MKQLLHCQYTTNSITGWQKIKIFANCAEEAKQKLENFETEKINNFKVTKREKILI